MLRGDTRRCVRRWPRVRAERAEPSLDGLELLDGITSGSVEPEEAIDALRSRYEK